MSKIMRLVVYPICLSILFASVISLNISCHRKITDVSTQSLTSQLVADTTTRKKPEQLNLPPKAEPKLQLTDEQWRERLSEEQYKVLRQEGTEAAWSGEYNDHKESGTYHCAGCGQELFSSDTKYDSKTGWPSFWAPISKDRVGTQMDYHLSSPRIEVHCSQCGGHLGHIFQDGPQPTGLRYCVNSVSLEFRAHGE